MTCSFAVGAQVDECLGEIVTIAIDVCLMKKSLVQEMLPTLDLFTCRPLLRKQIDLSDLDCETSSQSCAAFIKHREWELMEVAINFWYFGKDFGV